MPVWYEKLKPLVDSGKIALIGVIQEQHAERGRLYAQWKKFEFPIVQDQVTSNGLAVVPVVIFIDEYGIVQNTSPRVNHLAEFVQQSFPNPESDSPKIEANQTDVAWLKTNAESTKSVNSFCLLGDAYLNWGGEKKADEAIKAYEGALSVIDSSPVAQDQATKGQIYFRLGVAYRSRFDADSQSSQSSDDFSQASMFWSKALAENPNQYIWRRRIQQYGPRLEKPYPYYDWLETAQTEIAARGETPIELQVGLSGAEIAQPAKVFTASDPVQKNPDPDAKVTVDEANLVQVQPTIVPNWTEPGKAVRVHLRFHTQNGKWNNEAEPLRVWIDDSPEYRVSSNLVEFPNVLETTSIESRTVEFELEPTINAAGEIEAKGFALYNVCEADNGQCLYRRNEFSVLVKVLDSK